VTFLAVRGFPQTILPNPLISEMDALAAQACLALPLTEEIAADIFTGTFTSKWDAAAAAASGLLDWTLYARYYDLPGPRAWADWPGRRPAKVTRRWRRIAAGEFAELCASRARQAQTGGGSGNLVAVNGTILEQSQILTTHNLVTLIDTLGLRDRVAGLAPELADRSFTWIIRWLRQPQPTRHAQLQAVKNAAYAWRQAICFLSLCPPPVQADALAGLRSQVQATGDEGFQARFRPAVDGLAHAIAGGRFDDAGPDSTNKGSGRAELPERSRP
jgi:hypothetical protein